MSISLNGDGIVSGVTTFTTPLTGVTTFSSVDATSVVVGSAVTINSSGINIGVSTFYGDASGLTNVPAGSSVTGNFTITNGNVVVSSGYGIDFSATTDGSGTTTSEIFDDYEEGTWTPTQGNFDTWTSPTFNATYTKIGRLVHLFLHQTGGTIGWSAQDFIAGLPFTPNAPSSAYATDGGPASDNGVLLVWTSNNIYFQKANASETNLVFAATYYTA